MIKLNHKINFQTRVSHITQEHLLLVVFVIVPLQPLLIELNNQFGNLNICLLSQYQVFLVRPLPLNEEVNFSWFIRSTNDFFGR